LAATRYGSAMLQQCAAVFEIAIIITSLSGAMLDVFDWPKYRLATRAQCEATLSEVTTSQTFARLGAEFAYTTGEANFVRGFCYENMVPLDSNGNEVRDK
jgi:hypothetical protein